MTHMPPSPAPYAPPQLKVSGLSIAGFSLGVFSVTLGCLFMLSPVTGLMGVVLSLVALTQHDPVLYSPKDLKYAKWGVGLNIMGMLTTIAGAVVFMLAPWLLAAGLTALAAVRADTGPTQQTSIEAPLDAGAPVKIAE